MVGAKIYPLLRLIELSGFGFSRLKIPLWSMFKLHTLAVCGSTHM